MLPAVAAAGLGAIADVAGSFISANAAKKASKKDYKRAKEFAQNSIQWRVADAAAAGVSPLFALGAPTMSYAGSTVGADPVGSALSSAGQNISRAALALNAPETKVNAALEALTVERGTLENEKLRAELRLMNQPGSPAGVRGIPLSAKGDRGGGASVYSRDGLGNAFPIPPGMSAERFADEFGDLLGEGYGLGRGALATSGYLAQGSPATSSYFPPGSAAQAVWDYLTSAR